MRPINLSACCRRLGDDGLIRRSNRVWIDPDRPVRRAENNAFAGSFTGRVASRAIEKHSGSKRSRTTRRNVRSPGSSTFSLETKQSGSRSDPAATNRLLSELGIFARSFVPAPVPAIANRSGSPAELAWCRAESKFATSGSLASCAEWGVIENHIGCWGNRPRTRCDLGAGYRGRCRAISVPHPSARGRSCSTSLGACQGTPLLWTTAQCRPVRDVNARPFTNRSRSPAACRSRRHTSRRRARVSGNLSTDFGAVSPW